MGWKGDLDRQEQLIHRERRSEQYKKARHPDEVLSECSELLDALAFNKDQTKEEYIASLKINQSSEGTAQPVRLTNVRETQVTSPTSGTVFNATKWDWTFNRKLRKRLGGG